MEKKETDPKPLIITTSFPRFIKDEASVFVGRLVDAFSAIGLSGVISVPFDQKEPVQEKRGSFLLERAKYGVFSKGKLAFGSGIPPNLRKNKFLILQAPLMLLMLAFSGIKHLSQWNIMHANWLASGIPALLLRILTGRKYVLTVRGEDIKLLRSSFSFFFKPLVYFASFITTVSHDFEKELKQLFPNKRSFIRAVPNGVTRYKVSQNDIDTFCTDHDIDKNWNILCFTGRVVPLKRPDFLTSLLPYLQQDNFHLLLIGRIEDIYKEELIALANELGVSNRTHIIGIIPPKDIGIALAISSFYVSGSTHEGRSNSILEALAAGIPPCVSKIPGHEELVKDRKNGLLFPDNDNAEYTAKYILDTFHNKEMMRELSNAAIESVKHLTWEGAAVEFKEVFTELLNKN